MHRCGRRHCSLCRCPSTHTRPARLATRCCRDTHAARWCHSRRGDAPHSPHAHTPLHIYSHHTCMALSSPLSVHTAPHSQLFIIRVYCAPFHLTALPLQCSSSHSLLYFLIRPLAMSYHDGSNVWSDLPPIRKMKKTQRTLTIKMRNYLILLPHTN